MGFKVTVEPKEGYLHILASGDYSLQAAMEGIEEILKICGDHQATKVLVDIRSIGGAVPPMDRFHFGEAFAARYFEEKKAGKLSHARFAFLGKVPIIDPNRFGETVAVNRGMTLKATTELEEALDWLLVDPTG